MRRASSGRNKVEVGKKWLLPRRYFDRGRRKLPSEAVMLVVR
jgi:hypothetical protein